MNKVTSHKTGSVSMTQCYNRPRGLLQVSVAWLSSDSENTLMSQITEYFVGRKLVGASTHRVV